MSPLTRGFAAASQPCGHFGSFTPCPYPAASPRPRPLRGARPHSRCRGRSGNLNTRTTVVPTSSQTDVQRCFVVDLVRLLRVGHGGRQGSRLGPRPSHEGQLCRRRSRLSVALPQWPMPARLPWTRSRCASWRTARPRATPALCPEAATQLPRSPSSATCSKCSSWREPASLATPAKSPGPDLADLPAGQDLAGRRAIGMEQAIDEDQV